MEIDTNGFEIGDRARDTISGLEGIIVGISQWTTGCARATIQPPITDRMKEEGKVPDAYSVDVLVLEMIHEGPRHADAPAPELVGAARGGPMTRVVRRQYDDR